MSAALPEHVRRAIALGQGLPRESVKGRADAARSKTTRAIARAADAGDARAGLALVLRTTERGGRSKTQAAWAEHLDLERAHGSVSFWLEEAVSLRLADRTWYRPDFLVVRPNGQIEMHEVKGFWRDDARAKFKIAAELHPWAKFWVIMRAKGGGWSVEQAKVRA